MNLFLSNTGLQLSFWVMLINLSTASDPLIVAHRGASFDAPENTIPAFQLAWKQNADAIEGDFHLTRDEQIVCIHDRSTKKYCDIDLIVKESTLAELRKLDVGRKHGERFSATRIPTLAEVLATVPSGKKIYIEIKCGAEIVPILKKQIKSSSLSDSQIIIISFDAEVIQQVKTIAPQWKAFWLAGFRKEKSGLIKPDLATVKKTLKQVRADGFSSGKDLIDRAFIEEIKSTGYEYHVWTIDDAAEARKFREWGAQSITTNRPQTIRRQLSK